MEDILGLIVDELFQILNGKRATVRIVYRRKRMAEKGPVLISNFRPTKKVIGKAKNMIFEIYTDDHLPAHFHVTVDGYRAKFSIVKPKIIKGRFPQHLQTIVIRWAKERQEYLIREWNECRPKIIERQFN